MRNVVGQRGESPQAVSDGSPSTGIPSKNSFTAGAGESLRRRASKFQISLSLGSAGTRFLQLDGARRGGYAQIVNSRIADGRKNGEYC